MALNKRYDLIPADTERKVWLSIQDFRVDESPGIQLTLHDDIDMGAREPEELTVWLTEGDAHDLRAVLSVVLGVATSADEGAVGP